jgi:hypothetical protein
MSRARAIPLDPRCVGADLGVVPKRAHAGSNIDRAARHEIEAWTITDDWPSAVPVTSAEVDVFEIWFGKLFDELFSRRR